MSISHLPVIMPLAPKDMVNDLIHNYQFSLKKLAKRLHTSPRTLYRLQRGECTNPKVVAKIIMLYCELSQI